MLAVWFRTLMRYPNTRMPSTGIVIGRDDANLPCIVTIANANDLATTIAPAPRATTSSKRTFPFFQYSFVQVTFILYTVVDGTLCSFGQDTTSSLLFYPKRLCRKSDSLLFRVKFIYTAGISPLCDMVGMWTGMSFAFCSHVCRHSFLLDVVFLLHVCLI